MELCALCEWTRKPSEPLCPACDAAAQAEFDRNWKEAKARTRDLSRILKRTRAAKARAAQAQEARPC